MKTRKGNVKYFIHVMKKKGGYGEKRIKRNDEKATYRKAMLKLYIKEGWSKYYWIKLKM